MFKSYWTQIQIIVFLALSSVGLYSQAVKPETMSLDAPKSGIPLGWTRLFPAPESISQQGKNNGLVQKVSKLAPSFAHYQTLNQLIPTKCLKDHVSASSNLFTDSRVKDKSKLEVIQELFWTRNYIRGCKIREKILTWKEYLGYVNAVITEINDPRLEFLRSYRPVSLEDGELDSVAEFSPLTEEAAEKLNDILFLSPFWQHSFHRYRGGANNSKQKTMFAESELMKKLSATKRISRGDCEKYIRWLIVKHIGSAGLVFLVKVFDFVNPPNAVAFVKFSLFFPEVAIGVHVNTLSSYLKEHPDLHPAVFQLLGHEIVGHLRDHAVANIVDCAIRQKKMDKMFPWCRMMLNGVDLREQEYNADVQGFVSPEDARSAKILLRAYPKIK
ncbi:hypothetical protein KJZ61_03415 [Candidatus Dependentiae bacterium]|nr:hypothetical protein [Candidatus Dependentiae bacterium]